MPYDETWAEALAILTGMKTNKIAKKCSRSASKIRKIISSPQTYNKFIGSNLTVSTIPHILGKYYQISNKPGSEILQYAVSVNSIIRLTSMVCLREWLNHRIKLEGTKENCVIDETNCHFHQTLDEKMLFKLIGLLDFRNIELWDNDTYILNKSNFDNGVLSATFRVDKFLKHRFSFGLLLDELHFAIHQTKNEPKVLLNSRNKLLPIRNQLMPTLDTIFDFNQRLCAGGIEVLVAIARPKPHSDYALVFQNRAMVVADYQGLYCAVPRAFHQPAIDFRSEVRLSSTVKRELFEELLGGEEVERNVKRVSSEWYIKKSKPLHWLFSNSDHYDMFCVCHGINIITGNYNYGIVLLIKDEKFWIEYSDQLVRNWEIEKIQLVSSKEKELIANLLTEQHWTDESMMLMNEGLLLLKEITPDRMLLPNLETAYFAPNIL